MARSILNRLLGDDKIYKEYNFEGKYGKYVPYNARDEKPSIEMLLDKFDEKLLLVLDKLRKKSTSEQKEAIGLYKEQADKVKLAAQHMQHPDNLVKIQLLARSIQTFDDLLAGKSNPENSEQSLLLARDMGRDANLWAASAAFFGFLFVGFIVMAVVLAIVIAPIHLLCLIELIPCGIGVWLGMKGTLSASEGKEAFTSFTETGKGFFSDAEEGGVAHDEAEKEKEKEAEKSPWYWPFGGDSDK